MVNPPAKPPLPPPLSRIRTEFQKLCEEGGGPAIIADVSLDEKCFEFACQQWPRHHFQQTIEKWSKDKSEGIRFWPWMAFAVYQYKFRCHKKGKWFESLQPHEIRSIIKLIHDDAKSLEKNLERIAEMGYGSTDANAPLRGAHLNYISDRIEQVAAGVFPPLEHEPSGEELVRNHYGAIAFRKQLINLAIVADDLLRTRVRSSYLSRRTASLQDPELRGLVSHAERIWPAMSGKRASAEASYIRSGETEPPFVQFVQSLTQIAGQPAPSRKQVATALKPIRIRE